VLQKEGVARWVRCGKEGPEGQELGKVHFEEGQDEKGKTEGTGESIGFF
jgi:hypothetical protein